MHVGRQLVRSYTTHLSFPTLATQEIEGLRGQRDALARSLSFARDQYSDALGDKPVQIERLS